MVPVLHDLHPELFPMGESTHDDVFTLPFLTPLPRYNVAIFLGLFQLIF